MGGGRRGIALTSPPPSYAIPLSSRYLIKALGGTLLNDIKDPYLFDLNIKRLYKMVLANSFYIYMSLVLKCQRSISYSVFQKKIVFFLLGHFSGSFTWTIFVPIFAPYYHLYVLCKKARAAGPGLFCLHQQTMVSL